MSLSAATERALEAVYAVFATSPKPVEITGCPCCVKPGAYCALVELPLRQLTEEDLGAYGTKALTTVGSVADFRYLLPRLLDLCLHAPDGYPGCEILFSKLHLAKWQDWPVVERVAVEQLCQAVFDHALETHLDDLRNMTWDAETQYPIDPEHRFEAGEPMLWLCAFALARLPLEPFLDKLAMPAYEPVLIRSYYDSGPASGREMQGSFWQDNPAALQQVIDWFNSAAIQARILRHLH